MSDDLRIERHSPDNLTEHEEAHRIPEMTAEEWADFIESVRTRQQITDPVFALPNGKVFDGRHRLRAAREVGIKLIPVIFYDITEEEALDRMRQSATERRSLTPGQRIMINLEFTELVERLRAEARERIHAAGDSGKLGGRGNKRETPSADLQEGFTNKSEVAEQIAKLSGTSARNVYKAQAVLREAPDLAAKVKAGEITINKAETELKKRKMPSNVIDMPKRPSPNRQRAVEIAEQMEKAPKIGKKDEDSLSPSNIIRHRVDNELLRIATAFVHDYDILQEADEEAVAAYMDRLLQIAECTLLLLAEFDKREMVSEVSGQMASLIRNIKTEEGRNQILKEIGGMENEGR